MVKAQYHGIHLKVLRKTTKTSVRIASVQARMWTKYIPYTSPEHYIYTNILDSQVSPVFV
jgi:hypothetical protein